MNGWFLGYLIIQLFVLSILVNKHEQPVEDNYNFWYRLIGILIQVGLVYMAIQTGL